MVETKEKIVKVKETKPKAVKKVQKEVAKPLPVEATKINPFDAYSVIRFVLMTEKSVRSVEAQNKLVFIVKRESSRTEVKQAVEKMFDATVDDVKTVIDQKGRKKAFVKFKNAGAAGDIAIKLGII